MDIKSKMNARFRTLQGGLFLDVTKADVGEGAGKFMAAGGDIMAWADPFFPDPSIPESVKTTMIQAIEDGFSSHYGMPIGILPLREALAKHIKKITGINIDPTRNVIVTPGSDSGLLYSMMPFLNEGDEVLIPNPSYPSNFLDVTLLGGVSIPVPLYEEDNYQIRIEEFEKRLTPRTKLVLITQPNNPTTTVFRREGIEALSKFIIENDLILISDQAFEDHIYDGIEFVSPCTLPGMWERTVTVCSISKGLGLSGFRIGYIYADDKIMDVFYGGAVNVLGAASTLSSLGAITALEDPSILQENYIRLERRRKIAFEILSKTPGLYMKMSESGILSWVNISKLGTSAEVATYLMEHANILVNEGVPYGSQGEGHLRIVTGCFAEDEDAIERFERIRKTLTVLAKEKGLVK